MKENKENLHGEDVKALKKEIEKLRTENEAIKRLLEKENTSISNEKTDENLDINPDFHPQAQTGLPSNNFSKIFDAGFYASHHEKKILIIEQNGEMRSFFKYALQKKYAVYTARNLNVASSMIRELIPDLILSEVKFSENNVYDFCKTLKNDQYLRQIPIILMTNELQNVNEKIRGYECGAEDFISKPFHINELILRINALLRMKELYNVIEYFEDVVYSLANAVEAKDEYTNGHSMRLVDLAIEIGKKIGLTENDLDIIRHGAMLHDIGKIGIPEEILNKPGKLTDHEFNVIMAHPIIGEKICKPLAKIENFLPIIRNHHERVDGKGYPDGLAGEEISLSVRIVSAADAFDAIISDRPYRKGLSLSDTLSFFKENIGKGQWDDDIIKILVEINFQELFKKWEKLMTL